MTTTILAPAASVTIPGVVTDADAAQASAGLDAGRVPYAMAEVTLPLTDLTAIEATNPRVITRGAVTLRDDVAGTVRPFDLVVTSREVDHRERTMRVGFGSDEALAQHYTPLVEDSGAFAYQSSLRAVCDYVLSKVPGIAANLVPNPHATNLVGWDPFGSASLTQTTSTIVPTGLPTAFRATRGTGALGDGWGITLPKYLPVTPGAPVTGSVYARRMGTNLSVTFSVYFYDAGYTYLSGIADTRTISLQAFSRFETTGVVPDNAIYARIRLRSTTAGTSGDVLDAAGFVLEHAAKAGGYREIVLAPSDLDADMTAYWEVTNLLTEPGHEGALGWSAGSNATNLTPATPAHSGAVAARWTAVAAGESWIDTTGPVRVSPGRVYTIATHMRSTTSAVKGGFMVRFRNEADVLLREAYSDAVTLATSYQRISAQFIPPPGSTKAQLFIGMQADAAGRQCWNDDVMFYEGDILVPFFDGSTPDDANYTYEWSGDAQASSSTRIPVIERHPDVFTWKPDTSAWDFLMPLCAVFGYRLFCDEQRVWRLIDPATYVVSGPDAIVGVESGNRPENATGGTDSISRDDADWCTGINVTWSWNDRNGIARERVETAGVAGRVRTIQMNRPFPGRGLAAKLLARAAGQGRVQNVTALADLTVTPGVPLVVTLPGTRPQRAAVASVDWAVGDGLMTVIGTNARTVPGQPAAPTLTGNDPFTIAWSAPNSGGSPILGYEIDVRHRAPDLGETIPESYVTNPMTYDPSLTGLWLVSVRARNAIGWGPRSPQAQIIVA